MRLIDADILKESTTTKTFGARVCDIDNQPTVQAIPLEVLDKIRAEIENTAFKDVCGEKFIFVNRINQIIDKYKSESEEEK